ncbi:dynein regulatory complex subunit 5-like [Diachasmimorpha longicaudata]|uniref:dynein regulatory complex subunit 5-like n=1 Tax=Diachasmimorpha longicaudata TaxID=58733 RepID=UPI0030B90BF0
MNVILRKLPELRELRLNFGMIYMNEGFEWRDFDKFLLIFSLRFSVEDCLNLGNGIKEVKNLQKITITRSNLDQPRAAALLQGIVVNNNIQVLDFSHCKLGDTGAHAIGEFLKIHRSLRELNLTNNDIKGAGVAGIVHGLIQGSSTPLRHLDLRLNPLRDDGGIHIAALILRARNLENLNVSGCCFKTETGMALAEVIASGYTKIFFLKIDVSNNNMGPVAGEAMEVAVKSCSHIIGLDVRMCNFSKESEYLINETIGRNKEEMTKRRIKSILERKRSISSIPLQTKSLLPPRDFKDFQSPEHGAVPFHNELESSVYTELDDGSWFGGEHGQYAMNSQQMVHTRSEVSDAAHE